MPGARELLARARRAAARSSLSIAANAAGSCVVAHAERARGARAAAGGRRRARARRPTSSPQRAHDLDRHREQLGVGGDVRLADDVDVELEVLAQPPLLLPLVAEELRHREPAHRLAQRVRARRHHARERRRHLRAQRDLAAALVREVVELADDLVAALLRVELERLERRPVVLDEREPARNVAPGAE